jgi:VanZ family protein
VSVRRWLPPAVWAAFILVLTSIPTLPDVTGGIPIPHLDKVVHFFLYAVLGWLVTRTLGTRRFASLAAALIGIAVFGGLDELHQPFVGRDANLMDWIADVIGASIGIAAATRVRAVEAAQ